VTELVAGAEDGRAVERRSRSRWSARAKLSAGARARGLSWFCGCSLRRPSAGHRRDNRDLSDPDPEPAIVSRFRPGDSLDRIFEIGIILKGLDGVLETIGGLLLLTFTPATINSLVASLTQHELSEDPNDFIANHLLGYAQGLTGRTVTFAALYLLLHGIVKIVLVAALLRNQIWAYPWMIGFLLIFIVYQIYQIVLSPTLGLSALTIFDSAIVWLTWQEWRKQTAGRAVRLRE
jgi:uncharacterized membrane protein